MQLEPALAKVGAVSGRPLLDLLLRAGRLSLREPSALEAYWIHPLVLEEAEEMLDGFLEEARLYTYNRLLSDAYRVQGPPDPWEPPEAGRVEIDRLICDILDEGRGEPPGDWVVEALLPRAPSVVRRLLPASRGVVGVNGLHLYYRRFLDVAFFSRDKYAAIIEVKGSLREGDVEKALDQVLYYTYAVSRGLGIKHTTIARVKPECRGGKPDAPLEVLL